MAESDRNLQKKEFKNRLHRWVIKLIALVKKLPRDISSETIGKQVIRSGTSVLANYVEATGASSKKDFINFFHHSLKSANESEIWLILLKDTHSGNLAEVDWLLEEIVQIAKIFASSILTMKRQKHF